MSKLELRAGDAALTLLDPANDVDLRLSAARALASSDDGGVLEALIRVAQQLNVPRDLADAVGRATAQIAFRRGVDVHELVLANFSTEADDAYDAEVARLQRESPQVKMRRAS
jgi:hypothetical protein